jgi:glucose-6-phosphate 1-dehydrogenase
MTDLMTDSSVELAAEQRCADVIVIFGVTGDLAARKIFPALHGLAARNQLNIPVIGVGRTAWATADLAAAADRAAPGLAGQLSDRLRMVSGDYNHPDTYRRLTVAIGEARSPVFYLATPPETFPAIMWGLRDSGLSRIGRVVVEKPFGRDPGSAAALEAKLRASFPAHRIFRADHYLEKEQVEGLLVLRFENELFEPVWDRSHIAAVEITLAEQLGTEQRPGFYDGTGAIRDVLQNHMLQILALLAMERPADESAAAFHDAQAALLQAVRPLRVTDILRGQYDGYRDQPGVSRDSVTETFAAAELHIDTPRWAGVPFRVRVGKRMAVTSAEAVIEFRRPAWPTAAGSPPVPAAPNIVRFRLGRGDGVTISLQAKAPGRRPGSQPVSLSVDFDDALGTRQDAYERLLADVMDGNQRRFPRWDAIQEQWRIAAGILDLPGRPLPYAPGSWGPVTDHWLGSQRWHPLSTQDNDGQIALVRLSGDGLRSRTEKKIEV